VVLNDQELETLLPLLKCNEEGSIDYRSFVSVFTERAEEGTSSL
jgi:Ca2+-binding EF-hand superfamily protein